MIPNDVSNETVRRTVEQANSAINAAITGAKIPEYKNPLDYYRSLLQNDASTERLYNDAARLAEIVAEVEAILKKERPEKIWSASKRRKFYEEQKARHGFDHDVAVNWCRYQMLLDLLC